MPRLSVIAAAGRQTTGDQAGKQCPPLRMQVPQGHVRVRKVPNHAKRQPAGLAEAFVEAFWTAIAACRGQAAAKHVRNTQALLCPYADFPT